MDKKKLQYLLILLCLAFSVNGCSQENPTEEPVSPEDTYRIHSSGYQELPIRGETYLPIMGSILEITLYASNEDTAIEALKASRNLAEELEMKLQSDGLGPENEIAHLNEQGETTISDATYEVIRWGLQVGEDTQGLFNIALLPTLEAWGFNTTNPQVPTPATLERTLPLADMSRIHLEEGSQGQPHRVRIDSDMGLDLGGIGKGYATQEIVNSLERHGITSALVSIGGNIQVLHKKPGGEPFLIAIANPYFPDGTEGFTGYLQGDNEAIITSGNYQNFFEDNGRTYHHIIDPRTGYPAETGLDSVTIVSRNGTDADALATALFIMGPEEAARFWQDHPERFEAILVHSDQTVHITEGLVHRYEAGALPEPGLIQRKEP